MTRPIAYLAALLYIVGAGVGMVLFVQALVGTMRWMS